MELWYCLHSIHSLIIYYLVILLPHQYYWASYAPVYRVQLKPQTKPKVVHRNRLWRYSGSSFSNWLPETCAHDRDREQSEPNQQLQNEAQDKELELRRGQRNRRQPERFGFQCQLEASSSEEGEWCHRASV